ncbi:hypothetical protein CGH98_22970 [Vibrio parahaemolyticus]|nr:hypothetical protein CGK58_23330 [Vibrio parahaemolyticus]TOL43336.1 hypothetical protein CGH98_22970 [Vibrio parahaemolyticus]
MESVKTNAPNAPIEDLTQ